MTLITHFGKYTPEKRPLNFRITDYNTSVFVRKAGLYTVFSLNIFLIGKFNFHRLKACVEIAVACYKR